MPKEITHWMIAERVLARLPAGSRLHGAICAHRGAYLGGAVLPDTLAHIFRGPYHPTARQLGHRFHDPAANSYAPLIRAAERFPDGIPAPFLACFLGVISHMEADVALHPYVFAATKGGGMGEHYRLETAIDVHFLRRGEAPAKRRLDRLLCDSSKEVLVQSAGMLFDPLGELPRRALEHSLALHCRFQAMYDRTLWKLAARVLAKACGSPFSEQRHLFYPLGKSGGGISENVGNGRWRHPESGEEMSGTLEDLTRAAEERTVEVFGRIEQAGTFGAALAALPGANLLTGLTGVVKTEE
jgi:hypothetical protein